MSQPSTFLRKAVRLGLIGAGAVAILSAIVNLVAAWKLIEPADEQSLGITRTEITWWFIALIALGGALIYFGLRRKKP